MDAFLLINSQQSACALCPFTTQISRSLYVSFLTLIVFFFLSHYADSYALATDADSYAQKTELDFFFSIRKHFVHLYTQCKCFKLFSCFFIALHKQIFKFFSCQILNRMLFLLVLDLRPKIVEETKLEWSLMFENKRMRYFLCKSEYRYVTVDFPIFFFVLFLNSHTRKKHFYFVAQN